MAETGLSQTPPFAWVRQGGGTSTDEGKAIAADAAGNVYVTGWFVRSATFGNTTLTDQYGGGGMFIVKYDASGNVLWVKSTGTTSGSAIGSSAAVDGEGDCYVTGYFQNTVTFGGTSLTAASGSWDLFLAKYRSADGNLAWVRQFGTPSSDDLLDPTASVDSDGYAHVTGSFQGTAVFGATNVTSAGQADIFHARYDPAGNLVWVRKAGGLFDERGTAIGADTQGNTYVSGRFGAVANFDGILLTNRPGSWDIFLAKYDRSGSVVWAKSPGVTTVYPEPRAVSLDVSGNIYVAGRHDFDTNGFVLKLSPAGDLLWARAAGNSVAGTGSTPSGDVYVTGSFKGTSNFGGTNLTSRGEDDLFIARYNASGTLLWVKQAGFIYWDKAQGLALDSVGNIYVAGSFYDTSSFDGTNVTGRGDYDVFVAKLPASAPGALLVTTTNDSGPGSLRQAVLDANAVPGDNTIQILATGTIVLMSPLPLITGNTVIERTSTNLTISGDGRVGIFTIAASTTNTFRGLTIANGWLTNQNGAAISNGGTLTVVDCVVANNQLVGGVGGAMFNSGNLTLLNSLIAYNQVSYNQATGAVSRGPGLGGAIYNSGKLRVEGCNLSSNLLWGPTAIIGSGQAAGSGRGGAVYTTLGDFALTNSVLLANEVRGGNSGVSSAPTGPTGGSGEGGGVFVESGNVIVVGSTIASNRATGGVGGSANEFSGLALCQGRGGKGGEGNGGAMAMIGGSVTFINSTLSKNAVTGGYGGIRQVGGDGGDAHGGGLFVGGGNITLVHATLADNETYGSVPLGSDRSCGAPFGSLPELGNGLGGGICRTSGAISLRNCLVARNQVAGGFVRVGPDIFGTFTSQGHNLLGDTNGASGFVASDLVNVFDAKFGPLQDNGGLTLTHELFPDSPALDAAAPDASITVDQRGVSRPQGSAPDIGAFELSVFLPAFVDNFAIRRVISGYTNYVTGSNAFYTKEPGEPPHADRKGAHSAWLSWVALEDGICFMDTFGSAFDTVLAIYTGNSVSNLSLVASNDDVGDLLQSQVSFVATAGTAYQIAVDGYGSNDFGAIVLHIDLSAQRPGIVVAPQSVSVVAGSSASFNVVGRGEPPLRYQWLFSGNALADATNATLTIVNAQPANEGAYRVIVSNTTAAITSAVATLTILLPPSIVSPPQSQVVISGTNAMFSVGVNGTPPFSYQWRRNGTDVAGATGAQLFLTNIQPANAGNYTVVVTNPYGSATSAVAMLTVRSSVQTAIPSFEWVRDAGGPSYDQGLGIASDSSSNTYVTGSFRGSGLFGSTLLTNNYNGVPMDGMFIAKYDSFGTVLWAKGISSNNVSYGFAVAPDGNGNVFVTGQFVGTASFGSINLTSGSGYDAFLAKYSSAGNVLWVRQGRGESYEGGRAVAVEPGGGVHCVGFFGPVVAFGNVAITNGGPSVFHAKFDSSGNLLWLRSSASPIDLSDALGVAVDPGGNTYLAGSIHYVNSVANFNGILVTNSGVFSSAFLMKRDSGGNPLWVKVSEGGNGYCNGVALDGNSDVYLTGYMQQSLNLGQVTLSAAAQGDKMFVAKSDDSGNFVWGRTSDGVGISIGSAIAVDAGGNSYVAGYFNGTNTIDTTNLVSAGDLDIFVARFDPAGNFAWAKQAGSPGSDSSRAVTVDGGGSVYVTGIFTATAGFEGTNIMSQGVDDIFVAKISTPSPPSIPLFVTVQGQGTVAVNPDQPFYSRGAQVTLTAIPSRWHGFARWGDGPTGNPRIVSIGQNNSYTAIFAPTQALETLTFGGVTRTAPVGMPAVFVEGVFIASGTVTNFDAAHVEILSTFTNETILFTLDGTTPGLASTFYERVFSVRQTSTVRAVAFNSDFTRSVESDPVQIVIIPSHTLGVSTVGGGTVLSVPGAGRYAAGSLVTVTATPATGWSFMQWLGDASGTNPVASVTLGRNKCVEAVFGTTLNTAVLGGGSVMVNPSTAIFPYGTVARLTALPQAGNYFALWGSAGSGTNNPLSFTITNAQQTVTAVFQPLSAGQASVVVLVDGFGVVTNNPRGNRFNTATTVTLMAMPEGGQQFLGWDGDASGAQNPLTVMMNSGKVITARFTKRPALVLQPCSEPSLEDGFHFLLRGEFGARFQLEKSEDWQAWLPLVTVTNLFGVTQVTDATTTNRQWRVYRAVISP